jgi:hypothetical protein
MLVKSKGGGSKRCPPEAAPGPYPAIIIRESQQTSREGNPYLMQVIQLTEGEFVNANGETVSVAGMELLDNWTLKEDASDWRMREAYEAIVGEQYPEAEEHFDTQQLHNIPFLAQLDTDEFNGQTRAIISKYLPI